MTHGLNSDKSVRHVFRRRKTLNYEPDPITMTSSSSASKKRDLIRVFVKGGFLSPSDLLKIMNLSRSIGNKYILFGSRQDIMFPSNGSDQSKLNEAFRE